MKKVLGEILKTSSFAVALFFRTGKYRAIVKEESNRKLAHGGTLVFANTYLLLNQVLLWGKKEWGGKIKVQPPGNGGKGFKLC